MSRLVQNYLFCFVATSLLSPLLLAQAPAPPVVLPSDNAKQLLRDAVPLNNLELEGAAPWHMKATWVIYDDSGAVKDQGTLEEFWAAMGKYKVITTGQNFTQTDYVVHDKRMRTGSKPDLPGYVIKAYREITAPLPAVSDIGSLGFELQQKETASGKFSCVVQENRLGGKPIAYCLSADTQIDRSTVYEGGIQALHNRLIAFAGKSVGGDIVFRLNGQTRCAAHVESLEPIEKLDEALFTAPADAFPASEPTFIKANISAGVANGLLSYGVQPIYPLDAKAAHVTGTVTMSAVISRSGTVTNLQVLSGPKMLQNAAVDAVRQWKYRPYLLNGQPVEVNTTINVIFTLGG